MSDITNTLKAVAHYHQTKADIPGKKAFNLFFDKVKTLYYRMPKEEQKQFRDDWSKGKQND